MGLWRKGESNIHMAGSVQTYYSTPPLKELKGNWCHNCYMDEKRDAMELDGQRIKKVDIMKRKNDGEQEEAWVECDQCSRWVHQICGLFNKGRNNADVCYLCPDCLCQGKQPLDRPATLHSFPSTGSLAPSSLLAPPLIASRSQLRTDPQIRTQATRLQTPAESPCMHHTLTRESSQSSPAQQ